MKVIRPQGRSRNLLDHNPLALCHADKLNVSEKGTANRLALVARFGLLNIRRWVVVRDCHRREVSA
jgi:hypothetical protein